MTKRLEELLDLPENKNTVKVENDARSKEVYKKKKYQEKITKISELDKISAALPPVSGLGTESDRELDSISEKALEAYESLMDLGMNVEQRYSGRLFEVANSMLKTGLEAKVAKIEKKLKMVDLQLRKEKQEKPPELPPAKNTKKVEEKPDYIVTDRNSLLEKLRNINEEKNDKNE